MNTLITKLKYCLHKIDFKIFIAITFFMIISLEAQNSVTFKSRIKSSQLEESPVKLIPFPQNVVWGTGKVEFNEIQIKNIDQLSPSIRKELNSLLIQWNITISDTSTFCLDFQNDASITNEGYHLISSEKGVLIFSNDEAGQFYALQSMRQLVSNEKRKVLLQLCSINDAPKYPVRGYMLDVGRNYMSLDLLKEQLDVMAMYKMNTFQWHLTDRPAWRIENKKYPELTDAKNHRPTRNPGKFYSYNEIRELITYAREKQIQIIPEIDMPGHSDSFVTAMGCKMESEKGILILEDILNEFFKEIPKEMCPIIHLGSDEVHIKNPEEFMDKMIGICHKNDREVVVWNPGIKIEQNVIRQTWQSKDQENKGYREIDSWNNYINNSEPMTSVPKLLFKPIGNHSKNNVIGGILCMWPDVKQENEDDFIHQNPVYPSLLTYSWSTWTADIIRASEDYLTRIPNKGTIEFEYFTAFENYLIDHKNRYFKDKPFQYFKQTDKEWLLSSPISGDKAKDLEKNLIGNSTNLYNFKKTYGNTIIIKDRFKQGGYFPDAKPDEIVYATTQIYAENDKNVEAWIGFETPLRANRVYTGIAEDGSWDINGGNIWVNGEELASPKWGNPGWKPSKQKGWGAPKDQETPWTKEELYWTRKPTILHLKKGKNTIIIKIPSTSDYQNWMFTFIPLNMNGLKFSNN